LQSKVYEVTQQGCIFGIKNHKKSDAQAKQKYLSFLVDPNTVITAANWDRAMSCWAIGRIENRYFWKLILPGCDYCVVGQYKT